jgi:hypothetical protein
VGNKPLAIAQDGKYKFGVNSWGPNTCCLLYPVPCGLEEDTVPFSANTSSSEKEDDIPGMIVVKINGLVQYHTYGMYQGPND